MNVYEAIRYAVQGLPNGGYHSGNPLNEAIPQVKEWLAAYDALAPDWSNAPEWAQWYAIDADGSASWFKSGREPSVYMAQWGVGDGWEFNQRITLPIGIDWRLCKWQRPEVK